jgi:hypothetical protein
MSELMQASRQWASRPSDQRFTSLIELDDFVTGVRQNSTAKCVSSRRLSVAPVEGDNRALVAIGPNGNPVNLTHWSFGQLCNLADNTPASYMRKLPTAMAADCVNFGLMQRDISDVGVLLYKNGGEPELRAATGPNYGRIWNSTITGALVDRFGDGITGDFRVPGEFGQQVEVTKENTTLYASDRDMFVFLADETHKIEIAGRRDGKPGQMSRGFFVWNSEVGSATLGIATFLFDYVCCNRIVWGAKGYEEIKLRHTSGAQDRWIEQVVPAIEKYASSSTQSVTQAISDARADRLGDQEAVDKFLLNRFTKSQVGAIKAAHMQDEQRPIETVWDSVTGITAYARSLSHQDERVKLEREAGKLLN